MSLRQFLICAIVLSAFVAVYSLEDAAVAKDESSTDKVQDLFGGSASDMARRRKHRFGHHLWLGGIHAIGALVAIKFKLVLIFLAVMSTVFYGYKIYAGSSCPSPIISSEHIHSGPGILPFEGYSSSSYPGIYSSSYPGADPYSAYSSDHGPSPGTTSVGAEITSSGPYRRSGTSTSQKRSSSDDSSSSSAGLDISDLAFTLLGVESTECRKRFICEMSVNYNRNPILGSAYKMISRQFFPQYVDGQSKSLKECAKKYSECRGPNDPIPEENSNDLEEGSAKVETNVDEEESRAVKPKLDQVQKFVVGRKA